MTHKITKDHIYKLYMIFGVLNLVLSVLFLIFGDETLGSRILILFFLNFYYHLCYFAFIIFSKNSLVKKVSNENPIRIIFKIFVGVIIISLFLDFFVKLYALVTENNYQDLFMIFIQVGLFLGATSFWLSIEQE